jgi:hypothetical protein
MRTQTGWQPDWGWGELNLDAAYHERLNFARDQVPANGARFFRATAQAPGDRATLVWNRRVADCQPLRQGCYYDTSSGFRVYTLSNLDLAAYDTATGTPLATSASTVDNVEQVRVPVPGGVTYKVSAGDVDGPSGEPFAIAATRALTPLTTPQPAIALGLSTQGPVAPNTNVSVTATVSNPSPDLTADRAEATLTLPAGVELVAGERTQSLGDLGPKGSPGDHATASWTVRGSAHGLKELIASSSATRYGSTFSSSATGTLSVDAQPPQVTVVVPATSAPESGIPVSWSANEAATFDVDVAQGSDDIFTPWLIGTTATAATYRGRAGSTYRFRISARDAFGNTSPFVITAPASVASSQVTQPPPPQNPHPVPPSPQLRIAAVRRAGRRILIRGTVARRAEGRVAGTWTHRGRRVARSSTRARTGKFKLTVRIPRLAANLRRGWLVVEYLADRGFKSERVRFSIRASAR